jgi:hypothetical protein
VVDVIDGILLQLSRCKDDGLAAVYRIDDLYRIADAARLNGRRDRNVGMMAVRGNNISGRRRRVVRAIPKDHLIALKSHD